VLNLLSILKIELVMLNRAIGYIVCIHVQSSMLYVVCCMHVICIACAEQKGRKWKWQYFRLFKM